MALPIVFGVCLLFFGRSSLKLFADDRSKIDRRLIAFHLILLLSLAAFELRFTAVSFTGRGGFASLIAFAWFTLLALLVLSLAGSVLRWQEVVRAARSLRAAWLYAAVCALLAFAAREAGRHLWDAHFSFIDTLQHAAFVGVSLLLRPIYPAIISDPSHGLLGTPAFLVEVAGACSGIEGLTLILVLTVGWMVSMRKELRIERAILLIPLSLVLIWLLNIVRITALLVIGISGHPVIAKTGFHSEAGWIAFNLVSLVFLITAQNVRWFRRATDQPEIPVGEGTGSRNPTAIYLLPFLAIIAASMVSQAGAGLIEWLYPLRFFAAIVVLVWYRKEYLKIDWRFGPLGVTAGLAIAAMWIGLAHTPVGWHIGGGDGGISPLAVGLQRLSPLRRAIWILCRALAAIVTVPFAEELAFRGFVARRFLSADFEHIPYSRLTILAIAISSVLFGAMHGVMWPAGIVAGVVFALVAKRRDRLGEAVVAHATSNLVIALVVLFRGDYSLW